MNKVEELVIQSTKKFLQLTKKLLSDKKNKESMDQVLKVLSVVKDLDGKKLCLRYHDLFKKHEELLSEDFNLFDNYLKDKESFKILPGINLSSFWNDFLDDEKLKIWEYVKMMNTTNEVFYDFFKKKEDEKAENLKNKDEFNPYMGVEGSKDNISTETLFKGGDELVKSNNSPMDVKNMMSNPLGIKMMLNMMGIDQNTINQAIKQISNFADDKSSDEAKNVIKQILGEDNKDLCNMVDDVMNELSSEMKNNEVNSIDQLLNVVKNTTSKLEKSDKYNEDTVKNINIDGIKQTFSNMFNNDELGELNENPQIQNMMNMAHTMLNNLETSNNQYNQDNNKEEPLNMANLLNMAKTMSENMNDGSGNNEMMNNMMNMVGTMMKNQNNNENNDNDENNKDNKEQ